MLMKLVDAARQLNSINHNEMRFGLTKLVSCMILVASITTACTNITGTTPDISAQNTAQIKSSMPASKEVLKQMEKVANWQIPRVDSLSYLNFKRGESLEAARWVQGAFYAGLTQLAERSENPFYTKWIFYKGNDWQWRMGLHPFFGDDQLMSETYIWYYLKHKQDSKILASTIEAFDKILAKPPTNSLEFLNDQNVQGLHSCQFRWCWADALFMAPPTWFGLTQATGDKRYADYAHKEVKATVDYLFDSKHDLLYRDSRFKTEKDQFGEQLFWARGSGWVFAGLARMMEYIPKNDPHRGYYENLFKTMAAKLKTLQKQDGSWSMSLLAGERMAQPETSGTAFFTYGVAWGINNGLLNEDEYLPVVKKGWAVLNMAVHPDGKLGWVQQIGDAPDGVSYDDSQIYGVGGYLLAGSEIYDYQISQGK
ncbi:MAG: glycoside hydrolase family 88 protein [Paraglaciecola sp.]|uniref:glycoside hydrolase family 88/105 protein n=1 Tax=Paraglaciecola sp. TaxID=1920173 RepID=UPI00273D4A72|nr:glycoside hydrolase family 88 protein [Paraglaciecola sp.]MDP5029046.1 glycoside hydrolase family 88 protein [Paraglaciecola sp.]MDP5130614.1 glycoside hydrolase family 88 protein [Paraglaciecola sp.]